VRSSADDERQSGCRPVKEKKPPAGPVKGGGELQSESSQNKQKKGGEEPDRLFEGQEGHYWEAFDNRGGRNAHGILIRVKICRGKL